MKSERAIVRSYARVSAKLKKRIENGEFEIGARLPPERELAIFYDVSRPTIRETMIALEIEGFVAVRPGSGVYVISKRSSLGMTFGVDVDLFEILQARRAMGSEACALAAVRISGEQLENLASLVEEIRECHAKDDISGFECADRQFYLSISEASGNSVVVTTMMMIWDVRPLIAQRGILTSRIRSLGDVNNFEQYYAIIRALRVADGNQSRREMLGYYSMLINSVLVDMESQAIEKARARTQAQRDRYLPVSSERID